MELTSARRPILLDVDTGIDDAWALVYAANSATLDLVGVTTVFGNANLDNTTRNTLALLDLMESRVPVYRGSSRPLTRDWMGPVPEYHGHNGIGDAPLPLVSGEAESLDAAHFIAETIHSHPHAVTVVTVARLTNLARALLYDPELALLIDRVVMMGGAAFVPGNVTAVAEANIWGDPEAADIVFQSGVPVTMVGLDVTMRARLTRDDLTRLDPALPYAELLKQATEFYISAYERDAPSIGGWCPLHDPLAVAVAEDPSLVKLERFPVRVETRGQWTDGMTVVDTRNRARERGGHGVDIAVDLDVDRFLAVFRERTGIRAHRTL